MNHSDEHHGYSSPEYNTESEDTAEPKAALNLKRNLRCDAQDKKKSVMKGKKILSKSGGKRSAKTPYSMNQFKQKRSPSFSDEEDVSELEEIKNQAPEIKMDTISELSMTSNQANSLDIIERDSS